MPSLLLRLPSPAFPADLRTGDVRIDAYLESLDRALVGAAGIRRVTLLEARDELLSTQGDAGDGDTAVALKAAIAALGPADAIAREQHAARAGLLWRIGVPLGLVFACVMLVFDLLGLDGGTVAWKDAALKFVLNAVLFGTGMGYAFAYLIPKSLPSHRDGATADGFEVYFPGSSRAICVGLLLGAGMGVVAAVADLTGKLPLQLWSPLVGLMMAAICLRMTTIAVVALCTRIRVDGNQLTIDRFGSQETIPQAGVLAVTVPNPLFQLTWPMFGRIHRILWRDEVGRVRRTHVSISIDLVHGDRLIAWLGRGADDNRKTQSST